MSVRTAFEGELILAGWTESHHSGAKVSFWLPDAQALDAFRHLTTRKGNTAGQRFMAVLVEIGDDEQPVSDAAAPSGIAALGLPRGAGLSRSAGIISKSPDFQRFVAEVQGFQPDDPAQREEQAAGHMRQFCRVSSRRELDTSPTAAQLFQRLMTGYRDWCRAQGIE